MHVVFKVILLLFFLTLPEIFGDKSLIVDFIIIILTVADFWIIKNLTGRKLVGFRWWSEVN